MLFLDLANAFWSVPCNLFWAVFSYFSVPEPVMTLVKSHFQDIQVCLTTDDYTTAWQRLEIGIVVGCASTLLAFTIAMEVKIQASRWVVGGDQLKPGLWLPPIRAYMDNMTNITTTKACTRQVLRKLQENIELA